jgi:3-oxoacyl-[acyl-carrier-protein] synthase II
MKRVVVTGMGCVTPLGTGLESFAAGLLSGTSGAGPITKFPTDQFPVKRACEAKGFFPAPSFSVLDPFIQYGLAATQEAISDSGLEFGRMDPFRIGIAASSSKGGITTLEKFRERFMKKPSALLAARVYANLIPNMLAQWIARKWKIHGPAKPVVAACATGTLAIIEGVRMIEDDEVDVCIAGASDASITPFLLAGYRQLGVLAKENICPFDARRDGFLLGEGAGIVVLESETHATARRAKLYGHVLNYAYGVENTHAISFPLHGTGLKRCLERLMLAAKISPKEIDSFELHGTATKRGDLYETEQIKRAFGEEAYQISMSAIKSMTGHMVGAAGAVSFIAALLSIRDQFIPPTIHLDKPDPACDLDYTPNAAKRKKVEIVCSVSMGFGGQMGAILVGR